MAPHQTIGLKQRNKIIVVIFGLLNCHSSEKLIKKVGFSENVPIGKDFCQVEDTSRILGLASYFGECCDNFRNKGMTNTKCSCSKFICNSWIKIILVVSTEAFG